MECLTVSRSVFRYTPLITLLNTRYISRQRQICHINFMILIILLLVYRLRPMQIIYQSTGPDCFLDDICI